MWRILRTTSQEAYERITPQLLPVIDLLNPADVEFLLDYNGGDKFPQFESPYWFTHYGRWVGAQYTTRIITYGTAIQNIGRAYMTAVSPFGFVSRTLNAHGVVLENEQAMSFVERGTIGSELKFMMNNISPNDVLREVNDDLNSIINTVERSHFYIPGYQLLAGPLTESSGM
ncbi:hypothetical protein SPFM6_00293 [Salmonella phage SPFM6]|nr:hypothetical protein SPFM6_00293 [Salmonella phage SPFM6]